MSSEKLATEARQIIDGIRRHQINSEDKLSNLEKQVADMKKAVQTLTESHEKPVVIEGKDSDLKKFVRKDGTLRLMTEKTTVNVAGYGMVNVTEKGILDCDSNYSNWHKELKDLCGKKAFLKTMVKDTPKTDAQIVRHLETAPSFLKSVITKSLYDTAGKGAEFVPDEFRDSLYKEFTTECRLAGLFETVEVDRNTILVPRLNYGGRPYKRGSVTSDTPLANAYTASTPQTAQASISIQGFSTRYRVDMDLVEDSALPLIQTFSKQIYDDLVDSEEDCLLNGDTRNLATCMDSDRDNWNIRGRWGAGSYVDGSDHRQVYDGFRRQAYKRANAFSGILGGADLTAAKIVEIMSKLGEHASQDLLLITSPEMFVSQIMPISQVLTMDAFGPAATILNGSLASIFGVPIVLSRFMDTQLNVNGEYDGITKTKSGIIMVNRQSYKHYQKSGISVETAKEISSGALEVVSTLRRVLASPDQDATKNVVFATNTVNF